MAHPPVRADDSAQMWFYEQHRLLWTWVSELSRTEIARVIAFRPGDAPDYAIKRAWPGWGERWGLTMGSFACEVGGDFRTRCSKCPLGADYCQQTGGGYQKFLHSIRAGDLTSFKAAALEIRDAWKKPATKERDWW
ncbi:hypothetical protein FACS1894208_09810 [Clostridia bacterium]|nr:hypothetical protein FACS1894208_09810 [Clostridia bacterium]